MTGEAEGARMHARAIDLVLDIRTTELRAAGLRAEMAALAATAAACSRFDPPAWARGTLDRARAVGCLPAFATGEVTL